MRVHVTLEGSVAADPVARRLALYRVVATGWIAPGNPGRFAKHGIITGDMPLSRLDRVRAVWGVLAVEVDDEEVAGGRSIHSVACSKWR